LNHDVNFFAHTGTPNWQLLADHLREVARRARLHGAPLGLAEEAELAGLLHDLGKYAQRFQQRLKSPATVSGVNHWAAGAFAASKMNHMAAAFVIDGHHTGIPARTDSTHGESLQQTLLKFTDATARKELTSCPESGDDLLGLLKDDRITLPTPQVTRCPDAFANAMRVRMLFSCLVDADFLDTEQHFDGSISSLRSVPDLQPERALELVMARLGSFSTDGAVNQTRARLLADCLAASQQSQGLFTLTAPTGTGKTLASLAFALNHIALHNARLSPDDPQRFRRIIVVIPFTSIIEQTARVYRGLFEAAFGENYILEHHSSVAPEENNRKSGDDSVSGSIRRARLAAENWASPLVVTTNVQFFHSLFANKPSACRKLHNIGRSVVLFDEVQTLPPRLVPSLLSGVQCLVRDYGASAVFMTATQPAFASAQPALPYLWKPVEISSQPEAMVDALRRTRIDLPEKDATLTWQALAAQMTGQTQCLCVVNTTKDARELFDLLPLEGRFHLSARLCPAHRQQKLSEIRHRLAPKVNEPCRLVSTQLIEAGVDVDFPIAWRALGPLDSIIQTAGRCNREGRHEQLCPVTIFRPAEGGHLPKGYEQVMQITETFLHARDASTLNSPTTYSEYFARLYGITGRDNAEADPVFKCSTAFDFPGAAKECRLIEDNTRAVLVQWGKGAELYEKLKTHRHLTSAECRMAQRYSVNLYMGEFQKALAQGWVYQPVPEWELYVWNSHYDDDLGACHLSNDDLIC
jgi:CRISPR-associated endonuclease/helicase Cas3